MNKKGLLNWKFLFFILLLLVLVLRLLSTSEAIYDDEANFAFALTVMDEYGLNSYFASAQLLNLMYKPLIAEYGLQTWVFRLIPWLFGILNIILVFILSNRNFGKKVAYIASVLMLISFYPTLASLQIDVEGNLIMFSILLMFFSYLEYERANLPKKKWLWQILAGLGLGVAVALKYNSVYIILVLAVYSVMRHKICRTKIKNYFRDLFPIYFIGLLLFIALLLFGIAVTPESYTKSVQIFEWSHGFLDDYRTEGVTLLGLSMFVLWSTPLLFGFYFISLFKRHKDTLLFSLWVTMPILFYTFVITNGAHDRYFMHTIPAMCILGGIYISKINFHKYYLKIGGWLLLFFTALLFYINTLPMKYVPRFPAEYIKELLNLNPFFIFSYTSASGPTFGISFMVILLSFSIAFMTLFLCIYFIRKNPNIGKWMFLIFLVVATSYNIFLTSEYLIHPTSADVSSIKHEMLKYVNDNNLPYPIYTNDEGIEWYIDNKYREFTGNTFGIPDNEFNDGVDESVSLNLKSINDNGGTIILLHWPPLPKNSRAWDVVKECTIGKEFYSKKVLIGEIYSCS
jgi:hypothetical protein